jgi:cytochrome b561
MASAGIALPAARMENHRGSFDVPIRLFHWATVLLVFFLGASGYLVHLAPAFAGSILTWHRSAGAAVWSVTVLRLAWRRSFARLPPFPEGMRNVHRMMVTGSEYFLYLLLLVQPLTGLAATITLGLPLKFIGVRIPPLMAENVPLSQAFHELHENGALLLFGLIFVQASAALIHHYVLRDDILLAMLPSARRRMQP